MIYKKIERIRGDLTSLWKKVENYESTIATYLSLKKLLIFVAIRHCNATEGCMYRAC